MDGRACDMQRAKGSKAGKLTEIAMQRNGMKGTRQVTSTHTHSLFFNWMVSDAYPSLPRAKNTRMQWPRITSWLLPERKLFSSLAGFLVNYSQSFMAHVGKPQN